ncbi:hypothetical protein [Paraclostridium bifermentans]|uniref:hypothetical protein n=1 Tax=Paraclostridium bifermentans TaxID=1490 RepID=UPI00374ED680
MLLLENRPVADPEVIQILCEIYLYNSGYIVEAKSYEDLDNSKFSVLSTQDMIEETVKIVGEDSRDELLNFIGDFCTRYNKEDITWKYIATQKIAKAMEGRLTKHIKQTLKQNRDVTSGELRRIQELFVEFKRREKGGFKFTGKIISFVMGPCYEFFVKNKKDEIHAILTEASDLVSTGEDKEYSFGLQSASDKNISNSLSKRLGEVSDKYDIPKFKEYVSKIQKASFNLYKDVKKTNKMIANYDIFTDYKDTLLNERCIEIYRVMKKCGIESPSGKYFEVEKNKSHFYSRKITSVRKMVSEIIALMTKGVCLEDIYARICIEFEKIKDNQNKEQNETSFLEVYAGIQALREFTSQLIKEGWEPLSIPSDIFQNKLWSMRVNNFEDYMVSYDNLKALDYFDIGYDEENQRTTLNIEPLDVQPHNAIVSRNILTRFQDSIRNKQFSDMAKFMNTPDISKLNPMSFMRGKKTLIETNIIELQKLMGTYGILNYYCNIFEMYVSLFEDYSINETVFTRWIKEQSNASETSNSIFTTLLSQEIIEQSGLIKLRHVTGDLSVVNTETVNAWVRGEIPQEYVNTYNTTVLKGQKIYGGILRIISWNNPNEKLIASLKSFDSKLNTLYTQYTLNQLNDLHEDLVNSIKQGTFNDDIQYIANAYFDETLQYPTQEFIDGLNQKLFSDVARSIKELIYNDSFANVDENAYAYMAIGFLYKFCTDRNLIGNFTYGQALIEQICYYMNKSEDELTADDYYNFVRYINTDNYVSGILVDMLAIINSKRGTMLGLMDLMDKQKKFLSIDIDKITMREFCLMQGDTMIIDCKPRGERRYDINAIMDSILTTSLKSKKPFIDLILELNQVCTNTRQKFSITKLDVLGEHKHKLMEYANQIKIMPNLVNGNATLINVISSCTLYEGEYCLTNSILKSTVFNGKTYYLHKYGYWVTPEDDAEPILKYGEIK